MMNSSGILNNESLKIHVFNFGVKSQSAVCSALFVTANNECVLFNSQFERSNALKIITFLEHNKLQLKILFITHHDPDYYFGTYEFKKKYPYCEVISSAQTSLLIEQKHEHHINMWNKKLEEESPETIIIPKIFTKDFLIFNGVRFEIFQLDINTVIYFKEASLLLVSNLLYLNMHLSLLNINKDHGLISWINSVQYLKKINAKYILPGHYLNSDVFSTGASSLYFTEKYLQIFSVAYSRYKFSTDIILFVKAFFTDLPVFNNLIYSAKYFSNEICIKSQDIIYPVNTAVMIDCNSFKYSILLHDHQFMSFNNLTYKYVEDIIKYNMYEISNGIYMLNWFENINQCTIINIHNWNTKEAYVSIIDKNGKVMNVKGVISYS